MEPELAIFCKQATSSGGTGIPTQSCNFWRIRCGGAINAQNFWQWSANVWFYFIEVDTAYMTRSQSLESPET